MLDFEKPLPAPEPQRKPEFLFKIQGISTVILMWTLN